jgi:hypothetical protein
LLVGFTAGLLIPRPGSDAWALAWIEAHTGLSYRTALELATPDGYGFAPAVKARARQALRRLPAPTLQPWWLPMLVLAVSLLFLPLLGLGDWRSSAPASPSPSGPGTPAGAPPPQPDATVPPTLDEAADEPTVTPPEQASEAPPAPPDLTSDVDLTGRGSPGQGTARDAFLDGETLSRFLESLPPEPPREVVEAPVVPQGALRPEEEGDGDPVDTVELPARELEADGERETRPRSEAADGTEAEGAEENGDGETASQGEDPLDQLAQEPGQDQAEQGQDAEAEGGRGGGPDQQEQLGETPDDGEGDAAGPAGGIGPPVDPAAGESEQPLEFLGGQRQDGPATRAGVIRLPGEQPAELPTGSPGANFERAVEQAITEGRIPVEYQEILRNYFR